MARFNCSVPTSDARGAADVQVSARALGALQIEDADGAPCGPGWFESSRELVRGLDVMESIPGDATLNEWIRACLGR